MGLDCTAYEKVTLVEEEHEMGEDAEGNWCNESIEYGGKGHVRAYVASPAFAQSFRGLEENRCYLVDEDAEVFGFRAGSYSGHGAFRDALSETALGVDPPTVWGNPDAYKDEPFFELINFSDCEGSIGPEARFDGFQGSESFLPATKISKRHYERVRVGKLVFPLVIGFVAYLGLHGTVRNTGDFAFFSHT